MNLQDVFFQPGPIIWIQQLFGSGWADAFRAVDLLAAVWGVLMAVALGLWLWGRETAYAVAGIVVVEAVVNLALNQIFSVPRPSDPGIIAYETVNLGSFPSGHVFTATTVWGLLYLRKHLPLWVPVLIVTGVAVGRLYLGVHYLTDVVVGALLGVALLALFTRMWPATRRWVGERSEAALVTAGVLAAVLAGVGVAVLMPGNSFAWNSVGFVAGTVAAFALEWKFVRREPARDGELRVRVVALGLLGLAPLLLIDRYTGEDALYLGALMTFLAALWALMAVPTVAAWRGWGAGEGRVARDSVRTVARWTFGVVAVLLLVTAYGTLVEPRLILDVEEEVVAIPDLPADWEGARVAVLADFQLGMWGANEGMMRRAIGRVVEERPDAVLLAGDFVYRAGAEAEPEAAEIADILAPLVEAGIPTAAVLGNHDWGIGKQDDRPQPRIAEAVVQALESRGIPVLANRAFAVSRGAGTPLYLVGLGSHWAGHDRPEAALDSVPPGAPRVAFMHHPESFEDLPAGSAPLAVAAHTHGGQVRIPFTPDWSWLSFARSDEVHADGWIEASYGAAGNRLYVNRGIGFSLVPMRINCPPELTMFTLRSSAAGAAS